MTREALTTAPPTESGTHCCRCGRWTTAPVVVGYGSGSTSGPEFITHHVCPQHVTAPGPCTADHGAAK
ncbi:hypothetical protein ACSMX9_12870 [Streptomyces sp. LE64]|uniref:hypothetical protein n=1 Tax=Streptomyces sp. LE64 TaxID=3448653 RepID=UPI004041657E